MSDINPNNNQSQQGAISGKDDVRTMFDRIVPKYDLMNHVMTFGMDFRWRKMLAHAARDLGERTSERVLDVATGTGDVAFEIRKAGVPEVVGLDISTGMIGEARRKAEKHPDGVTFVVGDGMNLPFEDGSFDAVTISFGLRNMPDYAASVREMTRVLKPGGRLVCLEMTPFRRPFLGPLFSLYFEHIVPVIGWLVSRDYKAYKYLPDSVRAFPAADTLADIFHDAGLEDVTYQLLGFGTVAMHRGTRP
jgi:demethylmenaquinone methyltransferase / 2-methoxy-6-polyprenyl-1,4-benzoquinol methylase